MEVLLSRTDGGMESVMLARTKSVIHGSQRSADVVRDGIERIKQRTSGYGTSDLRGNDRLGAGSK